MFLSVISILLVSDGKSADQVSVIGTVIVVTGGKSADVSVS